MSKRIEEGERQRKRIEIVINMIIDGNSSDMEQLGEYDEDDEEWTPQAMHDDESSDSCDEEDYRDESVAQKLRSQQQHRTQSERSQ